ncbi:hypothetical protein HSEST_3087 (plasmid) [Halapricum desulfuricans]|uniref:Uncharacterized protein n=1 Tax=Halapricum desulfuricans TaxID=2841257 RepID=A0A897NVU5_9EURY|nr:hypothetical protein HSEST_3087 [Halapricum desulfuricans]
MTLPLLSRSEDDVDIRPEPIICVVDDLPFGESICTWSSPGSAVAVIGSKLCLLDEVIGPTSSWRSPSHPLASTLATCNVPAANTPFLSRTARDIVFFTHEKS